MASEILLIFLRGLWLRTFLQPKSFWPCASVSISITITITHNVFLGWLPSFWTWHSQKAFDQLLNRWRNSGDRSANFGLRCNGKFGATLVKIKKPGQLGRLAHAANAN